MKDLDQISDQDRFRRILNNKIITPTVSSYVAAVGSIRRRVAESLEQEPKSSAVDSAIKWVAGDFSGVTTTPKLISSELLLEITRTAITFVNKNGTIDQRFNTFLIQANRFDGGGSIKFEGDDLVIFREKLIEYLSDVSERKWKNWEDDIDSQETADFFGVVMESRCCLSRLGRCLGWKKEQLLSKAEADKIHRLGNWFADNDLFQAKSEANFLLSRLAESSRRNPAYEADLTAHLENWKNKFRIPDQSERIREHLISSLERLMNTTEDKAKRSQIRTTLVDFHKILVAEIENSDVDEFFPYLANKSVALLEKVQELVHRYSTEKEWKEVSGNPFRIQISIWGRNIGNSKDSPLISIPGVWRVPVQLEPVETAPKFIAKEYQNEKATPFEIPFKDASQTKWLSRKVSPYFHIKIPTKDLIKGKPYKFHLEGTVQGKKWKSTPVLFQFDSDN